MAAKCKTLILMSGTLHDEEVLRDLFGLRDFSIVDAEVKTQEWVDTLRPSVFQAIGRQRRRAQGDVELIALLNLLEEFMGYVESDEPLTHENIMRRRMLREQAWLLSE